MSIPTLSPDKYEKIMNIDNGRAELCIAKTIAGIEAARDKGLDVDLNVCVSYDIVEEIEAFIDLSAKYAVPIKLFPIISRHNQPRHENNNYFQKLLTHLFSIRSPQIDFSGRYIKIIWEASSGAKLIFKPGDFENRPVECYECAYFDLCEESCWESVRISPWYIQPCGIRTDNIYWFADNNLQELSTKLSGGGKSNAAPCHQYSLNSKPRTRHFNPFKKPFIVFEGADGSGKSHISQLIAKELDYLIYKTPPEMFRNQAIMNLIENEQNLLARYHYYLSAMHYANIEVNALLNYSGVVCDRWIDLTQIYHKLLLGESMPNINPSDWILSPDLIIVLDVDESTQKSRLLERGNGFDKIWETNTDFQKALLNEYGNLTGENVVHIDNNNAIENTINRIKEAISQHVFKK